jgi:lauroyl/myristoyl acyltransferase
VREPEVDPRAQAFIRESVRAVEGEHYTMHFQTDDPLQGVMLLDALRRGEIVAMQGDRPRVGSRSVVSSLFGRQVELPAGPAALARAAGVTLLPVFAIREGRRRYRVVFSPAIEVPSTGRRTEDVTTAMGLAASSIERAVRRAPNQWFVFREIWPA